MVERRWRRVKIRVMEVLASLKRAGAERMAVSLACGLDRERFETRVVSLFDAFPEGFEPVLAGQGIAVEHLGKRKGMDLSIYPRLMRVYRDFRPDIIHTHSYVMRYAFPASIVHPKGRLVHTVHNVAMRETEWMGRMIHRVAFACGAKPVAVAGEVARTFREVYGFDVEATIANGVDTGRILGDGAGRSWRAANGFSENDRLALSVARLDEQKNPLGLVTAFVKALFHDANWHLLLVGSGSLDEAVRSRVVELGLERRIHVMGVRADVREILAAADLFVMASHWEGNPMAVMEAMAAGLPVLSTAVGGVPELVEDGATGLLVPQGDSDALASAMTTLAGDTSRRAEFSKAALLRAKQFSSDAMVKKYAALFESLVGNRQ